MSAQVLYIKVRNEFKEPGLFFQETITKDTLLGKMVLMK